MSTSNSKPTYVLLATFITFSLLLLLNKVNSFEDISFSCSKFKPNGNDLIFEGDASISSTGVLEITKVVNGQPTFYSVGRARYTAPILIWDKTTGKVASFSTSFSFILKKNITGPEGSGFTFFLAPPDSQIGKSGPLLGLFNNENTDASNKIVAIEFDTAVSGAWDPSYAHIGVDVNGIQSIKTARWDWRSGEEAVVFINYAAKTKTLSASVTYPSVQQTYVVSASVDLKAILPEWVKVGFSAATAAYNTETHDILRWSFASTFEDDSCVAAAENSVHVGHEKA